MRSPPAGPPERLRVNALGFSARSGPKTLTGPGGLPRVWVLEGMGAGDQGQLLNLVEALGWPYEVKETLDPLPRVLMDRLSLRFRDGIPARKAHVLRSPWPELILTIGGRGVADALRIKRQSGGRTRVVCLGRPWAPLGWFDLVITTPQYRLPAHPRVVTCALPLNRPDPDRIAEAAGDWAPRLEHFPCPRIGVLLGGSSGSHRFPASSARALGRQLEEQARALGGSLLITSSPRTPPKALEALVGELSVPHYCHRWRRDAGANPFQAILGLADRLVVTGDSASMLAEACYTGKPVATFVPPLGIRARLLGALPRINPLRRRTRALRRKATVRGLWFPGRDMFRLHEVLRERGRILPMARLGESDPPPASIPDDLERAVTTIRALFPPLPDSREVEAPTADSRSRSEDLRSALD